MPDLELSWKAAAVMAGGLAACVPAMRRARPRIAAAAAFTRETALVLSLFALWQFAASHAFLQPQSALARGDWLWHAEQVMRLPSEAAVQHDFLPYPLIVQACNIYYAVLHVPLLMGCMIWLFLRHREKYRTARTTLIAFTASCLLIQLIPVAPPRMLPATGMVDTALRYGQSVYAVTPGFEPNQLSAMPSVHVGWAILAATLVIETARSRWRWLALAHPPLTVLVVVVTANHFWLDAIVAAVLLAAVLLVQRAVTGWRLHASPPESGPVSEKVDAGSSR